MSLCVLNDADLNMYIFSVQRVLNLHISRPVNVYLDITFLYTTVFIILDMCQDLTISFFRLSVASFSPWRPGFDPRPIHVRFVMEKVTL